MTKAELQKHGEKLAEKCANKYWNAKFNEEDWQGDFELYTTAFNQALELLFPLVDALKKIDSNGLLTIYNHSEEFMSGANAGYRASAETAKEALAELEKKVRGE
jgi:hypothetical protein